MSTVVQETEPNRKIPHRLSRADRLMLGCGAVFVLLILVGNSMTESALDPDAHTGPAQTRRNLMSQAASTVARLGIVLELSGLLCLAVFGAAVLQLVSRRTTVTAAGVLTVVGASLMVAVKLASAAPYLAALGERRILSAEVLHGLVQTNGAAFVVCWLPFGLFVLSAARALRAAGVIGRPLSLLGIVIGAVGVATGLVASAAPAYAVPIPFLLGAFWTLAASIRVTALAGKSRQGGQ